MVPKIYYTKEILQLIDDAIADGVTNYYDVEEYDKEKLAVYCMNALKEDAYVFITNNEKMEKLVCQLKTLLLKGGMDEAVDLATTLCEGAVEKLDQIMPDLFQERFNDNEVARNADAGIRSSIDEQTGEMRWVK